jgi:hypothetical protein
MNNGHCKPQPYMVVPSKVFRSSAEAFVLRCFVLRCFPEVFTGSVHVGVQLVVTLGDTRILCFSEFVCAYGISSKARPRPRMSRSGIGPVTKTQHITVL